MDKKEALKIVLHSAKMYKENLENKKVMFVCKTKQGKITYMEAIFLPRNFKHLTGLTIINKKIQSSIDFYHLCLKNQLKISDFEFNSNGTTPLKLKILPIILKIHKITKMIGNYNNMKSYLSTDKIVGGINACLGFRQEKDYYIPNTVLYEDIRKITNMQSKVIMILRKNIKDLKYSEITYTSNHVNVKEVLQNTEIRQKVERNMKKHCTL